MKTKSILIFLLILKSFAAFSVDGKTVKKYNPFNYKPFANDFYFVGEDGKTSKAGGIYFDDQANRYFILSREFLNLQTHVFVNKSVKAFKVEDLKKYKIAVTKGGYAKKYFEEHYPSYKIVEFEDYNRLMDAVLLNQVLIFADSAPDVYFTLNQNGALKYFRQIKLVHKKQISINGTDVKKFAEILKSDIEKLVDKKIEKQGGKVITQSQFRFYIWLGSSILAFIVLVIIILWLILKIKRDESPFKHFFKQDLSNLIFSGEGEFVEFKSSLRFDYKTLQSSPVLESVIAKSLCAFLNSHGGILLIGVSDSKEILGLENDYKTLGKKQNKDGFLLRLKEIINQYLGRELHNYLLSQIVRYEGKELCKITIKASKTPVFYRLNKKEEFYIRSGSSSQPLSLKESFEYIKTHFK